MTVRWKPGGVRGALAQMARWGSLGRPNRGQGLFEASLRESTGSARPGAPSGGTTYPAFGEAADFAAELLVQVVPVLRWAREHSAKRSGTPGRAVRGAPTARRTPSGPPPPDEAPSSRILSRRACLAQDLAVPGHAQYERIERRRGFRGNVVGVHRDFDGARTRSRSRRSVVLWASGRRATRCYREHSRWTWAPWRRAVRRCRARGPSTSGTAPLLDPCRRAMMGTCRATAPPQRRRRNRVELKHAVFVARVHDIDQVVAHGRAADFIFVEVFSSPDIEAPVDLPGVRRIISPSRMRARAIASAVLPDAVGPRMIRESLAGMGGDLVLPALFRASEGVWTRLTEN